MNDTVKAPEKVNPPGFDLGGQWIQLGPKEYKCPPLNFKALRTLIPRLADLKQLEAGKPTAEQMDIVVELVHAALLRHYPQLSKDEVSEYVDIGNFMKITTAVLGGSGLVKGALSLGEPVPEVPKS